jgi:hypothetical protein
VSRELTVTKGNAEILLDINRDTQKRDASHAAPTRNPHER